MPLLTIDMTWADEGKWIFATNEKGELLDIVQADLTNRSIQQLKTNKNYSSVDLTYLTIYREAQSNTLHANGTTYRNIPTSITADAGYPMHTIRASTQIGTVNVTVNNYPGSSTDLMITSHGGDIPKDGEIVNGQIIFSMNVFDNSEYLIISGRREGVPVYYREQLQPGNTTIEIDFNSFKPMENMLTLDWAEFANISGMAPSEERRQIGFLLARNYEGITPVTIGTIPGFERYLSYITTTRGQTLKRLGQPISAAENIEQKFINSSFEVTDRNLRTFSFKFSEDYDYKVSYHYETGPIALGWRVFASEDDEARMLFDIPAQVISAHPELAGYSFSDQSWLTIYKSTNQSFTYSDFLKEELTFEYKKEFEQLIITH